MSEVPQTFRTLVPVVPYDLYRVSATFTITVVVDTTLNVGHASLLSRPFVSGEGLGQALVILPRI